MMKRSSVSILYFKTSGRRANTDVRSYLMDVCRLWADGRWFLGKVLVYNHVRYIVRNHNLRLFER